jgi:hypothetical protein
MAQDQKSDKKQDQKQDPKKQSPGKTASPERKADEKKTQR